MKVTISTFKGIDKKIICDSMKVENGFIQFKKVKDKDVELEERWIASSSVEIVTVEKE